MSMSDKVTIAVMFGVLLVSGAIGVLKRGDLEKRVQGLERALAANQRASANEANLPVRWRKSGEWIAVFNGTNYVIEFGFRDDGSLRWRIADQL